MKLSTTTLIVLVLTLLTACKGTPPPSAVLKPTEPGTPIKVIINQGQIGFAESGTELSKKTIRSSTKKGALSGLSLGAASGFSCGPWALVCVPIGALAGTTIGAITGYAAGGIEAGIKGLPPEKADAMNSIINEAFISQELPRMLESNFTVANSGRYELVSTSDALHISVVLIDMHFEQHPKDEMTLHFTGGMQVYYGFSPAETTALKTFPRTSERLHIDEWLAEDGKFFMQELDRLSLEISEEMVRTLEMGEPVET